MPADGVTPEAQIALTPFQRDLLASQRKHPKSPHLNTVLLIRFSDPVDTANLAAAFAQVVAASDVLRTQISAQGVAGICHDAPKPSQMHDLDPSEVDDWARARMGRVHDLSQACYDSVILTHSDGRATWYLNLHHIVTDASGSANVVAATAAAYADAIPQIDAFYGTHAPDSLTSEAAQFWDTRPPAPRLDRLYGMLNRQTAASDQYDIPMSPDFQDSLSKALAGDYALITPGLSHAAYLVFLNALYLHRLSGADRFSIGLTVNHRARLGARDRFGPALALYPVDVTIAPDDSFGSLFRQVATATMTTLKHATPDASPAGDYDSVVNIVPDGAVPNVFAGLAVQTRWLANAAIDPDHATRLQWSHYDRADGVARPSLVMDVTHDALGAADPSQVPDHLLNIANATFANPDAAINCMALATRPETAAVNAWGTGPAPATKAALLPAQLRDALRGNHATVLTENDQSVSGDALWTWANAVAHHLQSTGARRIGLALPPGIPAVAAIYGAILAGVSFVPFDPAHPSERLAELADRAGVANVIDDAATIVALRDGPAGALPGITDQTEAYLLFTSGSSGEPKGVPVTQRGIANYIHFAVDAYCTGVRPVAPLFGALTFDLTLTTLFAPIIAGGQVAVYPQRPALALTQIAQDTTLNWCKATPSHLEILTRLLPDAHPFQTIIVGGEAFRARLAKRLAGGHPDARIFNEYGPTEAVVGCMIHQATQADFDARTDVPIGRPAPGVTLRIMDPAGQPAPKGAIGELWISHEGVTAGYLGDAADASKFVRHEGRRFYRSGDLVRLENAHLVYLGRADQQLKRGGIRVDPLEIEDRLVRHPNISAAMVRNWQPVAKPVTHHCVRCGLPDNVPNTVFDVDGVCHSCHDYDRVKDAAAIWFGNSDDLLQAIPSGGDTYDCMHLLSGGKDSTYALYQLVAMGLRPFVLTLDNGYLSQGARDNIDAAVADLGLDHIYATTPAMNAIFRDSLSRHSNVCHGCYKTLYVLAVNHAKARDIPVIVTGLSRGQLFETRLVPQQFSADKFDPKAIDRAVLDARKRYHRVNDAPRQLLDMQAFADNAVFDTITYVDFYRYIDVTLDEMLAFLAEKTAWKRPADSGRSTNCIINETGIFTHLKEQGYHNYAVPYAWDVRLGHKTRAAAIEEINDDFNHDQIAEILADVAYTPRPRSVLTAWFVADGPAPTAAALQAYLGLHLPAYALPESYCAVPDIPVTPNGKRDVAALPAPQRHTAVRTDFVVAATDTVERAIIAEWETTLRIEPISTGDDFFALGGDSLSALEMVLAVGRSCDIRIPEDYAFRFTTPKSLADAIRPLAKSDAPVTPRTPFPPHANHTDASPPQFSTAELSLLFEVRSAPDTTPFNVCRIYWIDGQVDGNAMGDALRQVAGQHVPLRWSFGATRTRLSDDDVMAFETTKAASRDAAMPIIKAFQDRPFDLNAGPLLRCLVIKLDTGQTAFVMVMHHIACDHDSFGVLWDQMVTTMVTGDAPKPRIQYPTLAASSETAADSKAFWLDTATAPEMPLVQRPPSGEADGYESRASQLSPADLRMAGNAPFAARALAAAARALEPHLTGDVTDLALVTNGRNRPEAADICGNLLNPLPVQLEAGLSETALLDAAKTAFARMLPHRDYHFSKIVADRHASQRPCPSARFLVSFFDDPPMTLNGLTVTQAVMPNTHAVADMTFFVEMRGDEAAFSVEYAGRAFSAATARLILARFANAMEGRKSDDVIPVTRGSVLHGPALQERALVFDQINRRLQRGGDAIAVTCGDVDMSWTDLNTRVAHVANALTAMGIGPGGRVALSLPRSCNAIAAMLGILATGAAYVPIDPGYPDGRIQTILDAANVDAAVQTTGAAALHPKTLFVSDSHCGETLWETSVTPIEMRPQADDTAYVIFTSGSTGTPRGIAIKHQQLSDSTNARMQAYETAPTRFAMVSSIGFDSSLVGLFWTLAHGGTVVMPTDAQVHDVDGLLSLITSGDVSHLLCVPSLYQALLGRWDKSSGWPAHVIVAGEASSPALIAQHYAHAPASRLSNEYGPTEATVWATVHHFDGSTSTAVPIGLPVPGMWVALLDTAKAVCDVGVAGEIVIGGPNVARGYAGEPTVGQTRFADGTALGLPAGRVFLTGDRGVLREDGIHFLGRGDDQINIGGLRIEPGDIESVLLGFDGVSAAIVTATQARAAADSTQQGLAAHLECATDLDLDALRAHVAAGLPGAMRPTEFHQYAALPRTPNGKLDRRAHMQTPPAPPLPKTATPASNLVAQLTSIFAAELNAPHFGPRDSFFEHGGHSLQVLNVILQVEQMCDVNLVTTDLYDAPTPVQFAQKIGGHAENAATDKLSSKARSAVINIQPKGTKPPIFAIHSLGENGHIFKPVSARLGLDQPVFGLGDAKTISMAGNHITDVSAPTDVREIAAGYVAELSKIYPNGPYVLCGQCLGGLFAYEVAQQMTALGRPPALLMLVSDLHSPEVPISQRSNAAFVRQHRIGQIRHLLRNPSDLALVARAVKRSPQMAKRQFQALVRQWELRQLAKAQKSGDPLTARLAVRDQIERGYNALHDYTYLPYAGQTLIIREKNAQLYPDISESTGWGDRLARVKIVEIAQRSHNGIRVEPDVAVWADIYKQYTLRDGEMVSGALRLDQVTTLYENMPAAPDQSPPPATRRIKATPQHDVTVSITDEGFFPTPQPEQRDWLLNARIKELSEELDHLHARSADMIATSGTSRMDGRAMDALTDDEIMEDWQFPVMQAMADAVARDGGDILEVGFGRGVASDMIQAHGVASHTMIDCNPHVIAGYHTWVKQYAERDIRLVDGMWQDVIDQLDQYDGIFFHTYPLSQAELMQYLENDVTYAAHFFPTAVKLLKPGGKFTYFNNEADSLSRAHQRALLDHFASFKIRRIRDLDIPETSRDAQWFNDMVIIEVTGN